MGKSSLEERYAKNVTVITDIKEKRNEKADSIYSNPDNDPRGVWTSVSYVNPATKDQRPNLAYPLYNPFTGTIVEHPTPVGHYSPDWAIVFHEGAVKHIYFVAETKGTMESLNLRPIEKSKIDCAKKLFAKLSDGLVTYDHVSNYQELLNKVLK